MKKNQVGKLIVVVITSASGLSSLGMCIADTPKKTVWHQTALGAFAIAHDGSRVAVGDAPREGDGFILVMNVKAGLEKRVLKGHKREITSLSFSSDTKTLVSASADNTVRFWNLETYQQVAAIERQNWMVTATYFPKGHKLLIRELGKPLELWDASDATRPKQFDPKRLFGTFISQHAIDPHVNSLALAVNSPDRQLDIRIVDIGSGKEQKKLVGPDINLMAATLSYSPNGKILAVGSRHARDTSLCLFDVASEKLIHTLTGHSASIDALAFSPDSKLLASGAHGGHVRIWNADTGTLIVEFEADRVGVLGLGFSADGEHLISAGRNGSVCIWSIESLRNKKWE